MNNRTVERIKKRFIAIAMLAIFLAMLFIGGTIWLSSLFVSYRAIRSGLDALIDTDLDAGDVSFAEYYIDDPQLTEIFSVNVREKADYWLVKIDGDSVSIDGRYAEGTEVEIIYLCEEIMNGEEGYGHQGRIWYKYVDEPDGKTIAFIDGTTEVYALRRLFLIAMIVCIAGLAVTYILVVHFSELVVASEVENFEKQKDFITNASHELKTPLSVIRANTEMSQMLNGEDEWSESTLKQIDHMNGLIANLVMISKAQELEDKTEMAPIDVSEVVETSVKSFESVALKSKITLEKNITPNVVFTADSSKIMQLTTILLDNAIKYC
ncbi:MAG: HAMP domain-containing histidine kinase, partial [Clostridiales bacterium]|nr:HAMP domain-containing histidine kinase [Clostridiales bacterium]